MTENYLKNITPDSLSGFIFAFEGIKSAVTLMNGPTGCKFFHSAFSDSQRVEKGNFNPLNYPELWYFGQPRVPCTYLDKRDYVYGSEEKIREALGFIIKRIKPELITVVNTPGAALIGDDLERITASVSGDVNIITVETPGYSLEIEEGYIHASKLIIDKFCRQNHADPKRLDGDNNTVNILGLSIFHKYNIGDIHEIKRLLKLIGIEVNCTLCCGSSIADIEKIDQASLNIVIDPLYGREIAEYLLEKNGTEYITFDYLPVGFKATEELIKKIAGFFDRDPQPALKDAEKLRADCYLQLMRVNSLTGLPKGTTFAIHGSSSACYGYSKFLIEYLGMVAETVDTRGCDEPELRKMLEGYGMGRAMCRDIEKTDAGIVLADGNIIGRIKSTGKSVRGIEIALPSMGYIDVIPKTHLGTRGAAFLVEQVLNRLIY